MKKSKILAKNPPKKPEPPQRASTRKQLTNFNTGFSPEIVYNKIEEALRRGYELEALHFEKDTCYECCGYLGMMYVNVPEPDHEYEERLKFYNEQTIPAWERSVEDFNILRAQNGELKKKYNALKKKLREDNERLEKLERYLATNGDTEQFGGSDF